MIRFNTSQYGQYGQEDMVRVLRVVEYVGPRKWVEETVSRAIQGTRYFDRDKMVRAATLGDYPEVLESGGNVS